MKQKIQTIILKDLFLAQNLPKQLSEMCIAISDPLQRRVHKLIPQSGELMMMDNSNVDNSDTKIVHLMCLSSAGGLPLATLVTTRKDKVLSYLSPYCQHMHSMDGVQVLVQFLP